ncbi:MAG: tripartite tricarboxylate transporter substrate binding protein [Burkholderiales bacterium]|nr:tripartite tricarboxylate transporter substrate binding protein [Burkholderiales bacterium]
MTDAIRRNDRQDGSIRFARRALLAGAALLAAACAGAGAPAVLAQSAAGEAAPPAMPKVAGFPARPLRLIINSAAGGSADIAARTIVPFLEKELGGANVVVVNRPGAGQQIGLQELALAKPDGYTMGLITLPAIATIYLDPRRKAAFGFKDFQALAQHVVDPIGIAVRGDSPLRSVKEVIEGARANPGKMRAGSTGILGANHLGLLQLEKQTGVRFATVQFDGGGAENLAAILGGNVDVAFTIVGSWVPHAKSGKLRFLALMDRERSRYLPEVRTMDELGYRGLYSNSTRAFAVPRGVRPEIARVLEVALQRAILNPAVLARMEASNLLTRYTSGAAFMQYWRGQESEIRSLMKLVGQ